MDREDKRGIFFGVVGVLTLIVAIIGATLAYFSINVQSKENALTVQAASVQIVYEDGDNIAVENLIPSRENVAYAAYNRWVNGEENTEFCKDDNGNVVCGVYRYKLTNNGTNKVTIKANIKPAAVEIDEITGEPKKPVFTNLKYALYNISTVEKVEDEGLRFGHPKDLDSQSSITSGTFDANINLETGKANGYQEYYTIISEDDDVELEGKIEGGLSVPQEFLLFVWLNAATNSEGEEVEQNHEQGAVFNGTVYIEVVGSDDKITGTITDEE